MPVSDPTSLVTLGGFVGAQVLIVCLSAVIANAYAERALLLHAAAGVLAVLALQLLMGGRQELAHATLLLVLALSGLHLRELVNHAGALRRLRRWLVVVSAAVLPLLALLDAVTGWPLLAPGVAAWATVIAVVMLRAWPQSQPWANWLVAGLLALGAACGLAAWQDLARAETQLLLVAGLLAAWSATTYLATVWRSRLFSETRVRLDARTTVDLATGLSTPMVLHERVHAARNLIRRYGHPSVLLLVHLENLGQLAAEFGPEAGEAALLAAASRVRQSMGDGDVAARVSHARFAVLAEGVSVAEGAANIASRILVAGLKEAVPLAPTEFLKFRVVLAAVPEAEIPAKAILQRLSARMDEQMLELSERRIHTLTADELRA